MPKIPAANIVFQSRCLAVVLFLALTFLASLAPSGAAVGTAERTPATFKPAVKPAFYFNQKDSKGKISAFKSVRPGMALEAILPSYHFSFQLPLAACQVSGVGYVTAAQQLGVTHYAARWLGVSFTSRIFRFTIQPNAP